MNTLSLPHSSSKSLKQVEFHSFLAASLLGVLFHFLYDWTDKSLIAGFFFPVNESIWEHLKLVFFPILLVSLIEYALVNSHNNFFCIKFKSALLGMAAVVILFYTYSGILGRNADWVNIVIYFLSMALAYLYSYKQLSTDNTVGNSTFCIIGATILIILFMIFSVYPPDIGLFKIP